MIETFIWSPLSKTNWEVLDQDIFDGILRELKDLMFMTVHVSIISNYN